MTAVPRRAAPPSGSAPRRWSRPPARTPAPHRASTTRTTPSRTGAAPAADRWSNRQPQHGGCHASACEHPLHREVEEMRSFSDPHGPGGSRTRRSAGGGARRSGSHDRRPQGDRRRAGRGRGARQGRPRQLPASARRQPQVLAPRRLCLVVGPAGRGHVLHVLLGSAHGAPAEPPHGPAGGGSNVRALVHLLSCRPRCCRCRPAARR